MISQEEKSKKVLLAEEKLAQAKAQLNKAKREQRAEIEKKCCRFGIEKNYLCGKY